MLTPEYLDLCAGDLVALYSQLDQSILEIVAARIAKTHFVSDTSKWQIEKLQEAGLVYDDVIAAIGRYTGLTREELERMFKAAGVETIAADNEIYTKAGLHPTGIRQSAAMTQVLRVGLTKTSGRLRNLTMTTAVTAQTAYINACDLAYMQISSGAMSMPEAVRHAVKSAVRQGSTVRYPTGHTDQLDVAIRRASVTGVNQTCAEIQLANAEDMGCNHVETTAHIGARPSHAEWQGRVFMINGSSREYPNLAEATGYGTGDGLCGWNCRHNFFPFFEGIDLRTYRDEDLEKLKNDGYYEAEQKQRAMERAVRSTKRELAGYDSAIKAAQSEEEAAALKKEFDRASVKLKRQEGKLKDWVKEKELTYDSTRVQMNYGKGTTQGFGRSVAQKAVWANRKSLQNAADGGKIKLTEPESAAVNAYVSSESYVINEKLRSKKTLTESETEFTTHLDSALQKLPKHEGIVYRSMSSDMIESIDDFWNRHKVGNMVNYKAYTSTSLEVYDESMDIQCVIKSKNGRNITAYNEKEKEILFERGSRFIITDVQGTTIFMEEV